MVNRFWLIFLLLLTGTSILNAQTNSYIPGDFYNTFLGSKFGKIVNANTEIKGSPYEIEEFIPGIIYVNTKQYYSDILLRYNMYSDQMEFKRPDGAIYEVNRPETIDSIIIGTSRYIHHAFKGGSKSRNGYFKVLTGGTPLLLLKMNVFHNPAEPPGAYKEAVPESFERDADDFYLLFPQDDAVKFSGKNEFLGIIGLKKAEMEKFIKKNKIRFNKQEDLIATMNYYYSLGK